VALLSVADLWRTGHIKGLELGGVSVEEARALGRPPMGYVREQLRERLAGEISRQYDSRACQERPGTTPRSGQ
jgi:hypothetical protein